MKLTVVQSVSNDGSRKLVRSSNHSIRCHLRSSSFSVEQSACGEQRNFNTG